MAQKTIVMSLIKQIQQLRQQGVAIKEIVRRVGLSRKTVKKYLRLMESQPGPAVGNEPEMTDKELAAAVFNNAAAPICTQREQDLLNHFEDTKKERQKTGANKQILW